ncbi:hypothetical protein [Sporomusa sp.]|uniref:hypothetical protein n=1 Tax=Sporomusa sp. TaxID=2078658 RepID=UPI002CF65B72|nr:hypothetical protein [Sporomusa sp.]HWR44238.1 hypothetical protein [Sporomusa sp.]
MKSFFFNKQIWIMTLVALLLLLLTPVVFAQAIEITAEGVYQMGDNDTPSVAEDRALLKAKRNALEQAGTYIASSTVVKNFQVTEDNVVALSAGVMKVNILDTKRTQVGNGMEIRVNIKAIVDTEKLDEFVRQSAGLQNKSTVVAPLSQMKEQSSGTGIVKFNGLYQASTYHGSGHYYYYYFRFFPDGTVTSNSGINNTFLLERFKALESSPSGSGKYSVQNGEIRFSIAFPKGNVDYIGTIEGDKLRLTFHSYIINTDGGYYCKFFEMN